MKRIIATILIGLSSATTLYASARCAGIRDSLELYKCLSEVRAQEERERQEERRHQEHMDALRSRDSRKPYGSSY